MKQTPRLHRKSANVQVGSRVPSVPRIVAMSLWLLVIATAVVAWMLSFDNIIYCLYHNGSQTEMCLERGAIRFWNDIDESDPQATWSWTSRPVDTSYVKSGGLNIRLEVILLMLIASYPITQWLRSQLLRRMAGRRRAMHRCVHCAYDLRGSSSRRCPECGAMDERNG